MTDAPAESATVAKWHQVRAWCLQPQRDEGHPAKGTRLMATYDELATLESDPDLQKKVEVALWVAVEAIATEDAGTANHANRLKHAKALLGDSDGFKPRYVKFLLAANKDQSLAAITGASDAAIQTQVNSAINIFADGA